MYIIYIIVYIYICLCSEREPNLIWSNANSACFIHHGQVRQKPHESWTIGRRSVTGAPALRGWSKNRWFQWIGLRENFNRKAPYLMGKSMVSCANPLMVAPLLVMLSWYYLKWNPDRNSPTRGQHGWHYRCSKIARYVSLIICLRKLQFLRDYLRL